MKLELARRVAKETVTGWSADHVPRLSAALAFYTMLSIAPLLVLVVSVAGLVFGEEAARGQLASQLSTLVGEQAGQGIQALLSHAQSPAKAGWSAVIGVAVLFAGASGVFAELQSTLDTIWRVEPKPGRGMLGVLRDRFVSFTMVLGVAFLLLVSLVLSTLLAAMGKFFSSVLPGGALLWELVNFVVSLGLITCLFALTFKIVPDVKVHWPDVWPGALIAAVLFTIGKSLLGFYLGRPSVSSPYGAAGSLVVLVIWIYYAAHILFLGAELTVSYARVRGQRIEPAPNAVASPPGAPLPSAGRS